MQLVLRRALLLTLLAVTPRFALGDEGLQCVQRPTFWIVGQWSRIVIRTPEDCGRLEVEHPEAVELIDRWPYKAGDTAQRLYFRARRPIPRGEIVCQSGPYRLALPVQVLSWAEVLQPRRAGETILPRVFPLVGKDEFKKGLSYLTRKELNTLRREGGYQVEEELAKLPSMGAIFDAMPESTIPRACYVDRYPMKGCPICGRKVFKGRSSFYPWILDYENRPFKVQCPECEHWFPDNDFASGDMTGGKYPDDGWGYFDETGHPYGFVAYYSMWCSRIRTRQLAARYADYYARTGDRRFGRAAALTLFRVAEQYLNLALNINQRKLYTRTAVWRGRIPPQGTPGLVRSWLIMQGNWEYRMIDVYAPAYEKIWDYLHEEDPDLIRFFQTRHHPEIKTMADVRRFIETGYFRVQSQACLDRAVIGNHPSGQLSAMWCALFLNSPRSRDIVEWVLNGDGGMRHFLTNEFYIDGSAFESPGYNKGHCHKVQRIAGVLDRVLKLRPQDYEDVGFPLITRDPKFKSLYDFNIRYTLIGRTHAQVGDSGNLAGTDPLPLRPGSSLPAPYYIPAFKMFPDDVNFARALWDAQAGSPIRELKDESLRRRVTSTIAREGPDLDLPSQVLDGYGHVILRSGKGHDRRALWMRYGQSRGHAHHDMLTLGFEALQRTLLPELGYNRGQDYRGSWDNNWCTHYTVRMLGENQTNYTGVLSQGEPDIQRWGAGDLRLFADGGWARVATAAKREHRNVDPPELYELIPAAVMNRERTIALVDLSGKASYAISISRNRGGVKHYWSFHGPRGRARPWGLDLTRQEGGTLAGPDELYGQRWDSPWGKKEPHLRAFPLLYDVHHGRPKGVWGMTWDLENQPDIHLRMHAAYPDQARVALAKGKPPGGGKPYELQWIVQQLKGKAPLETCFATVLEAYEEEPLIAEVRRLGVKADRRGEPPVSFQVVSGDRVDTIVHCMDPEAEVTTSNGLTMQGTFGIWSEEKGEFRRAFLADGTFLAKDGMRSVPPWPSWRGTIAATDFGARSITVKPPHPAPNETVGRYIRIANEGGHNARTHLVVAARAVSAGTALTLELDPRIGEGPVAAIHEDGITSGAHLVFGRYTYYMGKTLCNEDHSATYRLRGVRKSRAYINRTLTSGVDADTLRREFVDKEGDGIPRFVIYDYGPGDKVFLPNVVSRMEP